MVYISTEVRSISRNQWWFCTYLDDVSWRCCLCQVFVCIFPIMVHISLFNNLVTRPAQVLYMFIIVYLLSSHGLNSDNTCMLWVCLVYLYKHAEYLYILYHRWFFKRQDLFHFIFNVDLFVDTNSANFTSFYFFIYQFKIGITREYIVNYDLPKGFSIIKVEKDACWFGNK